MQRDSSNTVIHQFFAGLTEYAFHARLGVVDPELVDYITKLLSNFMRTDDLFRLRSPNGRRLDQVVDMLHEAKSRQGVAKRRAHRHIGDFTLFWTGMYPEVLERMRKSSRVDSLIDYKQQGKRAYRIAAEIPTEAEEARGEVLERLSYEFELCAYGLGEVRREWERRDDEGTTDLPKMFN